MEKKLENNELDLFEYARLKGSLTADEKAYIIAQHLEVLKGGLKPENKWIAGHPDNLARVLSALTLEERLEGMTLKEMLKVLTPQQIMAILGAEKFEELLRQDRKQQMQADEENLSRNK